MRQLLVGDDMDALDREQALQVSPGILLDRFEFENFLVDRRKLGRWCQAVDRDLLDLAAHLPGKAGDADHQEFVEIAARDREEAQPFEQGVASVGGFCEDAFVECKPAQLTVEIASLRGGDGVRSLSGVSRFRFAIRKQCFGFHGLPLSFPYDTYAANGQPRPKRHP